MASVQEALLRAAGVQRNAQQALPVLPNNGNPQGAYNAPQSLQPAIPEDRGLPMYRRKDFSWMNPSASMRNIQQMLQQRMQGNTGVVPPAMSQPAVPVQGRPMPAMAMRRETEDYVPMPRGPGRMGRYIP